MMTLPNKILNQIFPLNCPICDQGVESHIGLCPTCWQKLHFITKPQCAACGYPFENPPALDSIATDDLICGHCLGDPKPYDKARAAFAYDDISKRLILPFKHSDRIDLTPLLMKWLLAAGEELFADCDIITPVPLHYRRLLMRKYNQAGLLAASLAKSTNIPYIPDLLKRTRFSKNQGHFTYIQRHQNVHNIFAVRPKFQTQIIGKTIMLIDDVMTSGATISSCSKCLKAAGANKIYVVTLARVLRPTKL